MAIASFFSFCFFCEMQRFALGFASIFFSNFTLRYQKAAKNFFVYVFVKFLKERQFPIN
jgi:hypothetical protein